MKALLRQMDLDEELRNNKIWFDENVDSQKWNKL